MVYDDVMALLLLLYTAPAAQVSELQKKLEETRRESEIQALKVSRDHGDAASKSGPLW